MNGVHDLGGMDNFGPVVREENEPVFHEEWERIIFGYLIAIMATGYFKLDEIRRTVELIPPATYLSASYYEKWLIGFENILIEKDVLTPEEIKTGKSLRKDGGTVLPPVPKEQIQYALTHRIPMNLDLDQDIKPKFKPGDKIITKNIHPYHHTRIPRYVRGKNGVIMQDYGVFLIPDTNAHGGPDKPQHVYSVCFSARELWGNDAPAKDSLYIDLFDDYMDLQN